MPDDDTLLEEAFRLFGQGRPEDAEHCCQALLHRHCHLADVHYLLGLIRAAAGDTLGAENLFRRTLCLTPDHAGALIHLAVACRERGDMAAALHYERQAAGLREQRRTGSS